MPSMRPPGRPTPLHHGPVRRRRFVAEGLAERELLSAAPQRVARKGMAARKRAMEVAAAPVGRRSVTLTQVGNELTRLGLTPPRGDPMGARFGKSVTRASAHGGSAHATIDIS